MISGAIGKWFRLKPETSLPLLFSLLIARVYPSPRIFSHQSMSIQRAGNDRLHDPLHIYPQVHFTEGKEHIVFSVNQAVMAGMPKRNQNSFAQRRRYFFLCTSHLYLVRKQVSHQHAEDSQASDHAAKANEHEASEICEEGHRAGGTSAVDYAHYWRQQRQV